jgi:uncharacterized protein (TIGR03435 family)
MAAFRTLAFLVAATLILAAPARGQNPGVGQSPSVSATPEFDVVSIKPAKPSNSGSSSDFSNDTYTAHNQKLSEIMQYDAYGVPALRIIGIPPELEKAAFDIQAKIDPAEFERVKALPRDQQAEVGEQMVRQLLADRFKLVLHTETRELTVYTLVVAKSGPKLQPSKEPDSDSTHSHAGFLKAEGVTMERLASSLTSSSSAELGRVVIDKTGLTGKYDFTLRWTPENGRPPMINGAPDTSAPSIFTAIQEQLGLKLESTKAAVSVLVIDHAEAPAEN